jgi:FkbM family methyltransferase
MLKNAVKQVAQSLGYEFSKKVEVYQPAVLPDYPCIDLLDLVMHNYVQNHPDVFFVHIGAHDGISADPMSQQIRKYPNWRGILIEPQPRAFQQLKENYGNDDRFIFEQAVIGLQDGTTKFYTVTDEISDLSFWISQSASTDREHMRGILHFWKYVQNFDAIPADFDSVIQELDVPAMTMTSLLSKHTVEKLDLFALVTPGFDFDIIRSLILSQVKPPVICFEYYTLSKQNREACLKFLAEHGYSVGRFAARAVATLNTAPKINWTISDY